MKERLSRFTRLLMTASPVSFTEEKNTIKPTNSFSFEPVDKTVVGKNIFSFDNIDDFESMIKEFDRGLDIDMTINILQIKLSNENIDLDSPFNLRVLTS